MIAIKSSNQQSDEKTEGTSVRIIPPKDEGKLGICFQIARNLSGWFNEAGIKAMAGDLREEKTFVAVDEEILGFITLKPLNGKALEIRWMAIRRELRGNGIDTKLLRFVEEWVREKGFELLVVKTSGDLTYKPYDVMGGFVRVALIDPYPEWNEPAVIYIKSLGNA